MPASDEDRPPLVADYGAGLEFLPACEKYAKYFKMLKVGHARHVVEQSMTVFGVDPALLDHPEQMVPAQDPPKKIPQARSDYERTIDMPAARTFGAADFSSEGIVEIIPGKAWMIPNLLNPEECRGIISLAEQAGLLPAPEFVIRESKRTKDYSNEQLAHSVFSKLPQELHSQLKSEPPYWGLHGIHPNWRISKYESQDAFPAHYDGSDTMQYKDTEGVRRRSDSTHTVLIGLCEKTEYSGGATRFFLSKDYNPENIVDVELPLGGALVFLQKGLLHAGQPIGEGAKLIAQAGLLRDCLLYTSPSPRDRTRSRMPSSA
eukprot:TRINITY_DN2201_c0_g1_i2.p1 TRINITY_DN2201_c0_g1~~TRINITY_DN2201_c0_g1_i2.p1  ORF type:complete len:318 (+),score=71.98 TRINITY_DN2201_c0_g1_i2:190-1143(+)